MGRVLSVPSFEVCIKVKRCDFLNLPDCSVGSAFTHFVIISTLPMITYEKSHCHTSNIVGSIDMNNYLVKNIVRFDAPA